MKCQAVLSFEVSTIQFLNDHGFLIQSNFSLYLSNNSSKKSAKNLNANLIEGWVLSKDNFLPTLDVTGTLGVTILNRKQSVLNKYKKFRFGEI